MLSRVRRRRGLRRTTRIGTQSAKEGERQKVWRRVKAAVKKRAGGRCEVVLTLTELQRACNRGDEGWRRFDFISDDVHTWRCMWPGRDAHHVVKRAQSKRSDDSPERTLWVCRACHDHFDAAPQSKRGKLMAEPSASPEVAPRTWVTREDKWTRRTHLKA